MSPPDGPDIVLEFNGGVMTIRTQEAVYQVSVAALGEGTRTLPASFQPTLPGLERPAPVIRELPIREASPALTPSAADYYSELCHDVYRELGLLARRVATTLEQTARQGSEATAQEKLTRRMDRPLAQARALLAQLRQASEEQRQKAEDRLKLLSTVESATADRQNPLAPLAKRAQELMTRMAKARVQSGQAAGYRFGLDSVFQAVYDHCANQTVRQHLQGMWKDSTAFNQHRLEQSLNQISPAEPPPDAMVPLPLSAVLLALVESTDDPRYGQILQKLHDTREQLFPDGNLYLEAEVLGGVPRPPDPALLEEVQSFLARVQVMSRAASPVPSEAGEVAEVLLREQPPQEAARAQGLNELQGRLEELEDLLSQEPAASGQAGVRRLGEALVQLLALLAGLKVKLVAKEKDPRANAFQAEQQAQAQVEQALQGLAPGQEPGEPDAPNPKKVDRLLESLGF